MTYKKIRRICDDCNKKVAKDEPGYFTYPWDPDKFDGTYMTIDPKKDRPSGFICENCHQIRQGIN